MWMFLSSEISSVHYALVKFIQWYNEQKEK